MRLPHGGTIIAASSTSPIDALYLAAIFDPVFTSSYPTTRLVEPITLFQAVLRAFSKPALHPLTNATLVDLTAMLEANPQRPVVVFPECTTTNGRGILPFSPSLLTAPPRTKIFPVNIRYTPADITTPIPASYASFMWNLCSKPTHSLHVRIAEVVYNTSRNPSSPPRPPAAAPPSSSPTNFLDSLHLDAEKDELASSESTLLGDEGEGQLSAEERAVMERIGDALARLGRVKRVGLGVKEKGEFVRVWGRKGRRR